MLGNGATKKVWVTEDREDGHQCVRCELGCEVKGPEPRMDEEKHEIRQDVVEHEMGTRTQNTDVKKGSTVQSSPFLPPIELCT